MHKFYDRLTLEKRIHLIINAVLRADYEEVELLEQGLPQQILFRVERHAWAITRIVLFLGVQLASHHGQYKLLAKLQEQYAARQEAELQSVWKGLSDEMAKAKRITISHSQAVWEGFNEFWKIKNISRNPPEDFLRILVPINLDLWLAETKEMVDRALVGPEGVAETIQILNELWIRCGGDLLEKKIDGNDS